MADSNKIITALILVSLLATVVGSWIVLEKIADINEKTTPQIIIIRDDGASSGKATVTILAPSGSIPMDSAEARINILR